MYRKGREKMGKYRKKCEFFKKKGAVLLALLLCILNLLPVYPVTVQAAQSNDTPIDFVLILDCSGSMEKSDEENLSVSAAKMFVCFFASPIAYFIPSANAHCSFE